jgi:hypothetical protein
VREQGKICHSTTTHWALCRLGPEEGSFFEKIKLFLPILHTKKDNKKKVLIPLSSSCGLA